MKRIVLSVLSMFFMVAMVFTGCKQEVKGEGAETLENKEEATEKSAEGESETPIQTSPRKQSSGEIDGVTVNIDYGSPAVKGRKIWGGLESYGKVWRAGANETTSIEFSEDVTVNGEPVPAGKYAFFLIPNEEGQWVAILNEEWSRELHGAWGAFSYKQEKDVLRLDVTPEWSDEVMERLEYKVVDDGVEFGWEKARIKLSVESN